MIDLKWEARSNVKYNPKVKAHKQFAKVRGVDNVREYLNPSSNVVNNPLLLKNMDKAIKRIIQAINKKEKIIIANDSDSDGCTSTAIMYSYLKNLTHTVDFVYHEKEDGHGIQNDEVPKDTDLLIVIDSSSNEVEEVKHLSEDMDVIIIDHHPFESDKVEKEIRQHCIIINPKLNDCNYPNKDVCGGFLTYRTIEVLDRHYKTNKSKNYIDLAGLSLKADVMPLDNLENRYFLKQALSNIKNNGLLALCSVLGINPNKLDSSTLGFRMLPVINATMRFNEIRKVIELFTTNDFDKAIDIARHMVNLNTERKKKQAELMDTLEIVDENDKVLIAINKEGSSNYNGLIAGNLASKYQKPCIVVREENGDLAGSGRSYADFELRSFLENIECVDYALGHEQSFGVGFKLEVLDELRKEINERLKDVEFEKKIVYDLEINADDITLDLIEQVQEFDKISGNKSDTLIFRVNDVFIDGRNVFPPRKPSHTKLISEKIELLKFSDPEYASEIDEFDFIDCVGTLSINEFRGKVTMQVLLKDYKLCS